jgi:hypothetical protein
MMRGRVASQDGTKLCSSPEAVSIALKLWVSARPTLRVRSISFQGRGDELSELLRGHGRCPTASRDLVHAMLAGGQR